MEEPKIGFNNFCGPVALSVMTGHDTDECAFTISRINGNYKVKGVSSGDLIKAGQKLGLKFEEVSGWSGRSLFFTATMLCRFDGMFLITLPNHYIVIEIVSGIVSLCDAHSKQIINLKSSARLAQKIEKVWKVEKAAVVAPPKQTSVDFEASQSGCRILINRIHKFDDSTVKIYPIGSFEAPTDKKHLQDIAFSIMKIADNQQAKPEEKE